MPLEGVRILLVTRDRPIHDRIRTLCGQISPTYHGLEWAGGYRAALAALEAAGPDVCILDDGLLNGSGLDLLREPSLSDRRVPVILLLDDLPLPDEDPLARPGVADWIVKDALDVPSLQRALRHARRGRRAAVARSDGRRRERIVETLRGSDQLLNAAVDGMSDALFIKDTEGRYIVMNGAATALAGRSRNEVLGRRDDEVFQPRAAAVFRHRDAETMESPASMTFEQTLKARDGEERTYRITKGPLHGRKGDVLGVWGIARDVTDQKRRERELQADRVEMEGRIRVLEALLGVGAALREPGLPLPERLERIAGLVCAEGVLADRPGEARIVLHDKEFRTQGFDASVSLHRVPIRSGNGEVGVLEVASGGEGAGDATGDPARMADLLDRIARELGTVPAATDDKPN